MPPPRSRCASACPRACGCSPATTSTTSASSAGDVRSAQGDGHSDALLGAFAAITPVASAAIQALDAGDPDRYLAHPRPDRGAQPSGLRRADLLLQDRRRVPVLAQRPPDRLPDGRRPALGPQPPAPLAHRRARERVARARAARARRRALARHAAPERSRTHDLPCPTCSGAEQHSGLTRARAERRPPALDQPGDDQARRPRDRPARHRRGGRAGDRPVARARARGRARRRRRRCSPTPACASRRTAAAGSSPCPRARSAAPRSTTTASRSKRPRPSPPPAPKDPPRSSCSSPAVCPRAPAT